MTLNPCAMLENLVLFLMSMGGLTRGLLQLLRLVAKRHPAEAIHEAVGKVQAALQAVSTASTLSEQVLMGMLRF